MRVLVVDDDQDARQSTGRLLESAGWQVEQAEDAERAEQLIGAAPRSRYDLVLLDVRLPGRSGWDLLAELRSGGDDTPVIFVSGVGGADERVRGLRLGADDYLVKPYTRAELLARVDAVMRRRLSLPILRVSGLEIDTGRRVVSRGGESVSLSPHEFDLLLALVGARGRAVPRDVLLSEVWGLDFDPGTTVVEVTVGRLRRKLGASCSQLVENVKGVGYRLADDDVSARDSSTAGDAGAAGDVGQAQPGG